MPRYSERVRSHISQSLETSADQFADAVGGPLQLMGNGLIAETDDAQVNCLLLPRRELGETALHRFSLFPVQKDLLGIKMGAGMS